MNYPIIIVNGSIEKEELKIFIDNPYEELIKFTIDINQKKIAIGLEYIVHFMVILLIIAKYILPLLPVPKQRGLILKFIFGGKPKVS